MSSIVENTSSAVARCLTFFFDKAPHGALQDSGVPPDISPFFLAKDSKNKTKVEHSESKSNIQNGPESAALWALM